MEKQKTGVARLLQIAGKRKRLLIGSAILAVFYALLTIVPYVLIYAVIKAMLSPQADILLVKTYIGWAAISVITAYLLLYASGIASHVAAFNILYELRRQMADKLGQLPIGFINNQNTGALKKIMSDDIERIEQFIAHSIPDFVKGIALLVVTLVYLFTVDWRLALSSCIPMLLLALVVPLLFNRQRKDLLKAYHQSIEDMNAAIVEFVRAMPVIKIFGQTADSFHKYSTAVNRFRDMVLQWNKHSSPAFGIFISFISNATLPVLALGLYLYFSGGVTLPLLFLFLILGVGYIRPLFALTNLGAQLSVINHGVKRLDDILFGQEPETAGDEQPDADFSVTFDHVSFSYDEKQQVLNSISFQVPQGSITALVGPSGSGKSTAAQLVARFHDVQQGYILLGNRDIRKIKPATLMEKISFVFQDNFMFRQSIYENIRMGMDKSETAIIQAAKAAQCHEFITRLPQGYHTTWGAAGAQLSGGEQQRIQLARAILKDAPVLILDEATAFSDPENEQLIQQALSRLIQHKTVIIIAHRLSTIVHCQQIVVMNKGTIEGSGTHESLLQNCNLYSKMWNAHTRAREFAIQDLSLLQ